MLEALNLVLKPWHGDKINELSHSSTRRVVVTLESYEQKGPNIKKLILVK